MMKTRRRASVSAEDVKHWQVASGNSVDGERTAPIIAEYERLFSLADAQRMYVGLTEAMTNSKQHAYKRARGDGTGKLAEDSRWWMLCQKKDGKLYVAICDLGIGIPRSLREGSKWTLKQVTELVKSFGGRRDSAFIKAAVLLGRSSTDEEHRGKGLQDIKAVFDVMPTGTLRILSNRGTYSYLAEDGTEQLTDHSSSILGTLVVWLIPLPPEASDGESH